MTAPQNIYDDSEFFKGYSQLLRSRIGLEGAPEWAALRDLLPPLRNLRVLDLGCGFGAFSRWASENGASKVVGVDLSEKMLAQARERSPNTRVSFFRGDITRPGLAPNAFDLIYSALVLHYLADFDAMCALLSRLLAEGGRFVFSVEHPIYTAPGIPVWQTNAEGQPIWALNRYLDESERITDWIVPGVVKYHRTIASYLNPLIAHGFEISRLVEWGPNPQQIAEHPEWAVEVERPPFMLVGARLVKKRSE